MSTTPRVVVVTRATDYGALVARHGTHEAARFFLEGRGQAIGEVEARHRRFEAALQLVLQAIPVAWRQSRIDRVDLSRFLFEPGDVVCAVGQDGLVANAAKYLSGQPVIGVNPEPERFDGVLVPHRPERAAKMLHGRRAQSRRDRGAHHGGGPARRRPAVARPQRALRRTPHAPVGALPAAARGTRGAAVVVRHRRLDRNGLDGMGALHSSPREHDAGRLRRRPSDGSRASCAKAFPSVSTGTQLAACTLDGDASLEVVSEMNDGGTIFGDGIEDDRMDFRWGLRAKVQIAPERLNLVR